MRKKLIAIFSLICTLLLSVAVFAACNDKQPEEEPITLNAEELTLDINENFRLLVNGKQKTGAWSSSDSEIVSVDNSGLVIGLKEGEAAISVTVGEQSAECLVTVYRSGYVPVLETDQDEVTLGHSGEYNISPYVTVGGAKANDELSYSWKYAENADENVVSFTPHADGSVALKGKSAGTTELYVTTTARKVMLAKKVTVTVVDDSVILMITNLDVGESGYYAELTLIDGHGYHSSVTPEFIAYEGDRQVTAPSLQWETENKGVVSEENGTLTATSLGTETVTVSFGEMQISIAINVTRPVVASRELTERAEINLDAVVSDGALISSPTTVATVDLSSLELELESVASAKDEYGNALDVSKFTADGNTLNIAVSAFGASKYGDSQITVVVEDAYFAYEVTLPIYLVTKLIKSAADMDVVLYQGTDIRGYFALGSDVDYSGATLKAYTKGNAPGGFMGTFDGRGYTIKNYQQPQAWAFHCLFGVLRSATVKNVKFDKVIINDRNNCGLFAIYVWNSTIEDVEITNCSFRTGTSDGERKSGILSGAYVDGTVFRNVSIDMGGTTLDGLVGFGASPVTGMTLENVKIYNVSGVFGLFKKGVGVEIGNKTVAQTYRDFPGLKIYTDNGTNEYQF